MKLTLVIDHVEPDLFDKEYSVVYDDNKMWNEIEINKEACLNLMKLQPI